MESNNTNSRFWNVSQLYRMAMWMHHAIPVHLMSSGKAFPAWHYFFEVTRRCNLRCKMCQYIDWYERYSGREQMEGELSTDEWKALIDETAPFALITFTGGEVWVRRDFGEILEHASRKRRTHIISNGLLWNDERIELCVDLAPKTLAGRGFLFQGTSIDGTREMHNEIRGRADAFDKTLDNVRKMVALRERAGKRCPMLHVTSVVQESNLECLPDLVPQLADAGVEVYNLTMEIRFPGMEGLGEVDPATLKVDLPRIDRDDLRRCIDRCQAAADKCGMEIRLPDAPVEEILQYHDGGVDVSDYFCRSAWTNLYVGAKGEAYPCFIKSLGSVRDQGLRGVWNGEAMREFRKNIRRRPYDICQGCCHLQYGGKGCSASKEELTRAGLPHAGDQTR